MRATLGLAAGLAAAALVLAASAGAQPPPRALPGLMPAASDGLSRALSTGRLTEAEYALERARSLFQLGRVRREFGDVERPGGRDATLILRDLVVRKAELTGADRAAAEAILARPDDGDVPLGAGTGWDPLPASTANACSAVVEVAVCVHWVSDVGHPDAPNLTDDGPGMPNGVPDYVDLVMETLEYTWQEEVGTIGYRRPQEDSDSPNHGPDERTDVYIDDVGSDGLFGYCTTDDPRALDPDFAVSAYCVLDNDYEDFGGSQAPEDFLRVTAAHEFFHAVQAAYDFFDDAWLLEGTAANIEETIYEDIDDNVNFLHIWSPLTRPGSPLDRGGFGDSEYGAWIFWRYLEEKVGGNDPAILRRIWGRAANVHSLRATTRELADRGRTVPDTFVRFSVTNRRRGYEDAAQAGYPTPPLAARHRIGRGRPEIGWRSRRINHLASQTVAFLPRGRVARDARLRIRVEQPSYANGARVALMVVRENGSRFVSYPRPNRNGVVSRRAGFGRGTVKRVELVLANGSTRTRCWQDLNRPFFSCFGKPRDDRRLFRYRARIVD